MNEESENQNEVVEVSGADMPPLNEKQVRKIVASMITAGDGIIVYSNEGKICISVDS